MASRHSPLADFVRELRRRHVFRVAGYYVVGAWVALQVADVLFPGYGIPDGAIRALVWAAVVGFPVALVFGWHFDIGPDGIRRTPPAAQTDELAPAQLAARDWLVLIALAAVFGVIAVRATREVVTTPEVLGMESTIPAEAPAIAAVPKLENSVAVLPFDNLSSDPENGYFCDGIADEILNSLGRFTELNVIGRTSSFAFRYDRPSATRISELLGARFLLQGSVRTAGERVRISTQLLDERGLQVWSENFDREFGDAFAIQSEIAQAVARTVAPRIAPASSLTHAPDPGAYDHYLRGREAFNRRDRPAALEELNLAIERDPRFAPAHAELAATLSIGYPSPDELERARRAIDAAKALDPGNARTLAAEGLWLSAIHPPDFEGAERALRAALVREPSMVDAINWLSTVYSQTGNDEAGDALLERGMKLDPLHSTIALNYAGSLVRRGRSAEAEQRVWRLLLDRPAAGHRTYSFLMDLYRSQGRLADRYAIGNRMVRDDPPSLHFELAETEMLLGRWERGRYWYDVDVAGMSQPSFPEYRKPWVKNFETGWLAIQGHYGEAYERLARDPEYRKDGFASQNTNLTLWLGVIPGFAGRCEESVTLLGAAVFPDGPVSLDENMIDDADWRDAIHGFAWCLQQLGDAERAITVLDRADEALAAAAQRSAELNGEFRFFAARNAALRGEVELAFEHLEAAVDAGWRSLNLHAREPAWADLRTDPRAAALLDRVAADIAAERAKAEAMDAEWDPIEWHRANLSPPVETPES